MIISSKQRRDARDYNSFNAFYGEITDNKSTTKTCSKMRAHHPPTIGWEHWEAPYQKNLDRDYRNLWESRE